MKVGDYVRTKHFGINKIKGFYSDVYYDYIMVDDDLIKKEDIIKSSPNIIDLIEYDDVLRVLYDNEEYICKVVNVLGNKGVKLTVNSSVSLGCLEIKSIVTKEQFESMEYKVGD